MENAKKPILPGATVIVVNSKSIYKGYKGFVQRITNDKVAVLFEGGNWDKLVSFRISEIELV